MLLNISLLDTLFNMLLSFTIHNRYQFYISVKMMFIAIYHHISEEYVCMWSYLSLSIIWFSLVNHSVTTLWSYVSNDFIYKYFNVYFHGIRLFMFQKCSCVSFDLDLLLFTPRTRSCQSIVYDDCGQSRHHNVC